MPVYFLVFLACLGGSDECRRVELPWDGTLQQCLLFGQQLAAQWVVGHPGWELRRGWGCATGWPA